MISIADAGGKPEHKYEKTTKASMSNKSKGPRAPHHNAKTVINTTVQKTEDKLARITALIPPSSSADEAVNVPFTRPSDRMHAQKALTPPLP